MAKTMLRTGDPAPWFVAPSTSNPTYVFNSVAGRYVALLFFGSANQEDAKQALQEVLARRALFDDSKAVFFGVTIDRSDQAQGRIEEMIPGIRYFLDYDLNVSRLYGAIDADAKPDSSVAYSPRWVLLDPMLRVLAQAGIPQTSSMLDLVAKLPPVAVHAGPEVTAPVLLLPRVFEPEFCRHLISLYDAAGGEESGFMRERDGKTVHVSDYGFKRRRDYHIEQEEVRAAARTKILQRVVPEIKKVFQFQVTRMERYIVACYDAETGGFFRPHRDDTTKGTAHRRFAMSVNLNTEEYEGGDLRFPEFGPRTYRPPTGGVVVFSCSLLHEATPVTRGKRYAFLPFLYDDAAAKVREQNNPYLGEGVGAYRAGDIRE